MRIYYIPPVIASANISEQNMIEKAISSAIQNTIVLPFCSAVNKTWIKFIDTSYILCLAVAFTGALCGIIGIKKGWKVTAISIVFYLLLRFFSWAMGWY